MYIRMNKKLADMTKDELIMALKSTMTAQMKTNKKLLQKSLELFDDDEAREAYLVSDEYKKEFARVSNQTVKVTLIQKMMVKKGYANEINKIVLEVVMDELGTMEKVMEKLIV